MIKRRITACVAAAIGSAGLLVTLAGSAYAADPWTIGQRVTVNGSDKKMDGVVVKIGDDKDPVVYKGCTRVHFDYEGPDQKVGQWFCDPVGFGLVPVGPPAGPPVGPKAGLDNPPAALVLARLGPEIAQAPGKPSAVLAGNYECYALTGGRLSPRGGLNFTILAGGTYRDAANTAGTYSFDAASSGIVFTGAGLDGQRASYAQPSTPPVKRAPPAVTFALSGDSCDLQL
jgi:hypothetical protein